MIFRRARVRPPLAARMEPMQAHVEITKPPMLFLFDLPLTHPDGDDHVLNSQRALKDKFGGSGSFAGGFA